MFTILTVFVVCWMSTHTHTPSMARGHAGFRIWHHMCACEFVFTHAEQSTQQSSFLQVRTNGLENLRKLGSFGICQISCTAVVKCVRNPISKQSGWQIYSVASKVFWTSKPAGTILSELRKVGALCPSQSQSILARTRLAGGEFEVMWRTAWLKISKYSRFGQKSCLNWITDQKIGKSGGFNFKVPIVPFWLPFWLTCLSLAD